jgi:hypothetical protein
VLQDITTKLFPFSKAEKVGLAADSSLSTRTIQQNTKVQKLRK